MGYLDFSGMNGPAVRPSHTRVIPNRAPGQGSGPPFLVRPPVPMLDPAFDRRMPAVPVFQRVGPDTYASPPVGWTMERF
jgi:hypothetical protein